MSEIQYCTILSISFCISRNDMIAFKTSPSSVTKVLQSMRKTLKRTRFLFCFLTPHLNRRVKDTVELPYYTMFFVR